MSWLTQPTSMFDGAYKTAAVEQLTLGQVLTRNQDGTYKERIAALRALRAQDVKAYKKQKTYLPAFTPGCALHTRAQKTAWKDKLIAPTQIIHLDVDGLDAFALKARVVMEPSVIFAFISPSGEGLKLGIASAGIVDTTTYSQIWRATIEAWKALFPDAVFKEDEHVKFLHALCFVSHDPDLYVNDAAVPFLPPPSSSSAAPPPSSSSLPEKGGRKEGRSLQGGRKEGGEEQARVEAALSYIPPGVLDEYGPWLNMGMALHDSGEPWARGVWDTWSARGEKYDAAVQDVKWASFHEGGGITLGTLFRLARDHGYLPPPPPTMSVERGTPAQQPPADGPTPQEAAEALLALLPTLPDDDKEDAILDAMPALAGLDMIGWMRRKRQLKAAVPRVSLNALERAWNELRRAARAAQGSSGGSTQARLAAALAVDAAGKWAYDLSRQGWMAYSNGLWQSIDTALVNQHIGSFMDDRLQGEYTWNTLNGVEHLLRTRLARTLTMENPGWLPFRNGALHVETLTLYPHNPDRAFIWQLPYHYTPQAPCPKTQAWLHEAVGGADDQVQVLRAYLKAVVTRRVDLERYMEMIGPGGTGKGTYTRLLTALVGRENTFATELKYLEANRFETSNLRGKVLMVVTDAERYSGPVTQLKAITGEDVVRMEEKFKAQRSETAPVMVAIAANEPIQSADYTSGLVRRRLSMAFRHRPATPRDLLSWHAGDWRGELAPEIPGVLNWVLALPDAQMEALLLHTTTKAPSLKATWAQALVETNPLADWANQFLIHDSTPDAEGKPRATKVGIAKKRERSNDYEQQDYWLYPNYRAWIDATGQKPLAQQRFTGLLLDLLQDQLRLSGVSHKVDVEGSRFFGIRLRSSANTEDQLLITKSTA